VAQSAENLAAHFGIEQLAPDEYAVLVSRLCRTYLLRGMRRRAASLTDELESLARRTGLARVDARHAIARADLAAAAGDHREALDWLDFAQSRCEHEAPSSLANETLLRRTEVAVEAEELDLAISLANQLRDTATRLNHLHTARRADELRALAVAKLGQDREAGIRRLRLYRQQAHSRGVPREMLEATTYLARALEAVEPEESDTLLERARDMASALRLPLPS
jgi:hypothetical protein